MACNHKHIDPKDLHKLHLGCDQQKAQTRILISVCLHGNEPCGMYAVNELIEEGFFEYWEKRQHQLQSFFLSLPCLPKANASHSTSVLEKACCGASLDIVLGNPAATLQRKRFLDINLNRMMDPTRFSESGYESKIAPNVFGHVSQSTHYLDIHSCSSPSPPFALPSANNPSRHLARYLPVSYVIQDIGFHTVKGGTTIDLCYEENITGLGIEAGQHDDPQSIVCSRQCIKAFLNYCWYSEIAHQIKARPTALNQENLPILQSLWLFPDKQSPVKLPFEMTLPLDTPSPFVRSTPTSTAAVLKSASLSVTEYSNSDSVDDTPSDSNTVPPPDLTFPSPTSIPSDTIMTVSIKDALPHRYPRYYNYTPPVLLTCTKSVKVRHGFKFITPVAAFSFFKFGDIIAFDSSIPMSDADKDEYLECPISDSEVLSKIGTDLDPCTKNSGTIILTPYPKGAYMVMPASLPIIGEEAWFWAVPAGDIPQNSFVPRSQTSSPVNDTNNNGQIEYPLYDDTDFSTESATTNNLSVSPHLTKPTRSLSLASNSDSTSVTLPSLE